MRSLSLLTAALLLAAQPGAGEMPLPSSSSSSSSSSLSQARARGIVATALAEARRRQAGGAIAVVDEGGHLLCMERLEGTFPAAARVCIGKARTAALFRKPTRVFEEAVNKGRFSMTALEDFTPLQGGVPIQIDGRIVGAIGVSGAASAQADDEIATLAAESASAPRAPDPSQHLEARKVSEAFAKGDSLLAGEGYAVNASRRDAPGEAELHESETDIFHVLEGSAEFVIGGVILDAQVAAAGEMRGSGIRGGTVRRLVKGDVIVVPKGTPHWFRKVDGPFLCFVVKVG